MSESSFKTLAPYHVIAYGTLLGTQFYQSFVGGIVSFRALPRPQFSSLQQKIFPVYFGITTALPVVVLLTYPGTHTLTNAIPSGFAGALAPENKWAVLIPIATMFATSLSNMLFIGPATTKIMKERKHQETRDGKKSYDPAPHSKEMQKLNKAFGKLHGASSLVNMIGFVATVWYGFSLGARIQ